MGRLVLALMVVACTLPISTVVNYVVPDPYMDEIFHVPQAQRYCKGDFNTWDPMITTLPGLYYASLAYIAPLFPGMQWTGKARSFQEACSTAILRSVNISLAIICALLFYDIIIELRPETNAKSAIRQAFVLSLYPLHWFFTFLFYTDVGSTTAVMAMYLACIKRSYWLSALLGSLAIIFRQTNIVWVAFVACMGVLDYLDKFSRKTNLLTKADTLVESETDTSVLNKRFVHARLKNRRNVNSNKIANNAVSEENLNQSKDSECSGVLGELQVLAYRIWCEKWGILTNFYPFLLVAFAFLAFVIHNGSIVVGAKEAHSVSPHFAQILYFGLASAVAMAPVHFNLSKVAVLCQSFREERTKFLVLFLAALISALLSVQFFSLAHPYLLADNRHYPFYIWRKVIQAHWLMKYLLTPLYVYSWWSIFNTLGKSRQKVWIIIFFFAAAGVVVPAPLIEFRYYTIPFYFIILHAEIDDRCWILIGMQYIIVNLFAIALFLFKPFHWDHESGLQRFMW